ncbi:MAG TPA: ABC transporter permease [Candidatus Angelobacter sp.]|nr:ABC transporter permease [Candidatus Angelobacter sp.]
MAIPVVYNLRSVKERWASAIVAVLGIAGTVGVFVAVLSLAKGFKATLVSSGSADNAIVRRAGSTSEIDSNVPLDQVKILQDAPGVARAGGESLVSPEVVLIAPFPLITTGTDANVQVRGISAKTMEVRSKIKLVEGRMIQSGLYEMIIGRNVNHTYAGLTPGSSVKLGGATWQVVGVFDAGGSAFDSELWCDGKLLKQAYHRPEEFFNSVTVHLSSPEALQPFKDAINADPRMSVDIMREVEYYEKQSRLLSSMIQWLGSIVAGIMGIGAVFGALNTMYSAVAERSREIATLRALGFGAGSVVFSFLVEAMLISLVGGLLGAVAVLPLNGLTTGAMNWQTFSHLAFAFRITPLLLGLGILFALFMGLLGGFFPALRAARRPVAAALRAM